MPPVQGFYFYENIDEKTALELVRQNPNEIQYIRKTEQSERVQMAAVKQYDDALIHIFEPTDKVKEYVLKKNPAAIINITLDNLTEQDWQIAIMTNADVLRKWWVVYEEGKQPSVELWGMWLMFLSKTQTMTLRYLKRKGKTDLIPLTIQFGLIYFFEKTVIEFLPNGETIAKIPRESISKIADGAQRGKFEEKKALALLKLYKD